MLTFSGAEKDINKVEKLLSKAPLKVDTTVEPPAKRIKLEPTDSEKGNTDKENIWLRVDCGFLTDSDREDIIQGKMLNDKHITIAQRLLLHQFPGTGGLMSTLYQSKPLKKREQGVQIFHDRGGAITG
jgi:hypothetical protein